MKEEPEDVAVVEIDSEEEEEAEKVVKRRRRRKKTACEPHKKRACVDCTKRCARIHGRGSSSSSLPSSSNARAIPAVPSFFKVMMGYFSEDMVCSSLIFISLHVPNVNSTIMRDPPAFQ